MAEILFKIVDATNLNPTKDQRGCYKRGDPVVMFEDGHQWGNEELKPPKDGGRFAVVRITGTTCEQIRQFVRNKLGTLADLLDAETSGVDELGNPIRVRRRRIGLRVDLLPGNVRSQLNNTGFYETTWAAIRSYVRDKVDGVAL